MIYLWFYITVFLFVWYSSKLLKDTTILNQYFHIPQFIFLIAVYLFPFFVGYDYHYLIKIGLLGLQFPFLFNTGLNAYRKKVLGDGWFTHTGEYDFLDFIQTVILFVIGVLGLIIYEYLDKL